jgi:hypothetical protein
MKTKNTFVQAKQKQHKIIVPPGVKINSRHVICVPAT